MPKLTDADFMPTSEDLAAMRFIRHAVARRTVTVTDFRITRLAVEIVQHKTFEVQFAMTRADWADFVNMSRNLGRAVDAVACKVDDRLLRDMFGDEFMDGVDAYDQGPLAFLEHAEKSDPLLNPVARGSVALPCECPLIGDVQPHCPIHGTR